MSEAALSAAIGAFRRYLRFLKDGLDQKSAEDATLRWLGGTYPDVPLHEVASVAREMDMLITTLMRRLKQLKEEAE